MENIIITKNPAEAQVVTHGGVFHADEVMAVAILSEIFGREMKVSRVFKVPNDLPDGTIVLDIGGGKYDHHQRGGNGARENGAPYASCGLIWREFGKELLKEVEDIENVWRLIDEQLISGIDAIDCGAIPRCEAVVKPMTISAIISSFNPAWDSTETPDEAFVKAVDEAKRIFDRLLANTISKVKAVGIVEAAIENSKDHIMVLETFVPWQDALFASDNPKAEEILFVVFPSNRGGFNWQAVPESLGNFAVRKSTPKEWWGAPAKELQELTGVRDATFCHPNGFIGAAMSKDGAIRLAKLAIEA